MRIPREAYRFLHRQTAETVGADSVTAYRAEMAFLLVTGASGVGKSVARRALADELAPSVVCVELADVVPIPPYPDLAWRQRSAECVIRRALALQTEGRHLMLCGDPVAPGELLAAPSADALEAVDVCLLDCRPEVQLERLRERGDPPDAIPHHLAFAEWLRGHVQDPAWRPEVITMGSWDQMRWDRWLALRRGDPNWRFAVLDTSDLPVERVAVELLKWARKAIEKP